MPLALGFALAVSAALGTTPAPAEAPAPATVPAAQTVRGYVQEYFADVPVMANIAECESHYRQYNTEGDVFRGKENHKDVGVMQINEHYHLDTAEKLGFDIYTIEGNTAYARYLFEREGTTPWDSSKSCWGKTKAAQKLLATVAK
jgi:hypothetical protein